MNVKELLQIKVRLTDPDALKRLTPEMVIVYLSRHGWKQHRQLANPHATQWYKGDDWLLVPMEHSLRDYTMRISEVIHQLGRTEDRSELAIYVEMLEASKP